MDIERSDVPDTRGPHFKDLETGAMMDAVAERNLDEFARLVRKADKKSLYRLLTSLLGIHDLEASAFVIENGVSPNVADAQGGTALMFAAIRGDVEVVSFLLDHGAFPMFRLGGSNWTALDLAIANGHGKVAHMLVAAALRLRGPQR